MSSEAEISHQAEGKAVPEEEVREAVEVAKAARMAQNAADKFKELAAMALDPHEREKYLREAYDKEMEAHGHSKKARVLASGWGQGAIYGTSMGAAVSAGLGTVVGTLVGSVATIPTGLLGFLGGTAVGAVKGPIFKLGDFGKKKKKDVGSGGDDDAAEAENVAEDEKMRLTEDDEPDFDHDEEGHQAVLRAAAQAEELEKSGKSVITGKETD